MLDKIFNFISNLANKLSEKDIVETGYNYRNKLFVGTIIIVMIFQGIRTYQVGECIDCVGLTGEEAIEMLNNGTSRDNQLSRWYQERTYIPYSSVGKFLKQWLINTIGPVVSFSLIFFALYFLAKFINSKIQQFKNKKLADMLNSFGYNKKKNK